MKKERNMWLDGIMGVAVGDALGVPVEFRSREELKANPVTDMREYGTYNLPKGTWSDDTSMTWATLDSLKSGYDPKDMADKFCDWAFSNKYTPRGVVFDAGNTTQDALQKYERSKDPYTCGEAGQRSNGNGALMRILPVCLYCFGHKDLSDKECMDIIFEASAITHAHLISKLASVLYCFMCCAVMENDDLKTAVSKGLKRGFDLLDAVPGYREELKHYERLRDVEKFADLPESQIKSGGYVVDALEASIWCLLNTNSYADCVLKAVNLGSDTDTTAAIAGGAAGLFYGYDSIPKEWKDVLAKKEELEAECAEMLAITILSM